MQFQIAGNLNLFVNFNTSYLSIKNIAVIMIYRVRNPHDIKSSIVY